MQALWNYYLTQLYTDAHFDSEWQRALNEIENFKL